MSRVVILGAGHAGGSLAGLLRQYGHQGPIHLIGEEPIAPYQRPPLSKAWLKGEADAASLALRPDAFYGEADIDFRPGVQATAIDRAARRVTLSEGESLAYDWLVIATGRTPIRLQVPGAALPGVLALRTAADAERLKTAIRPGGVVAVIGAGYVGLEVAASARALGAEVVVIERAERVLARAASAPISRFLHQAHDQHGVRIVLGAEVGAFLGEGERLTHVALTNGQIIACDVAVVGVGARAEDQLARAAGLTCDNGVVVNARTVASDPAVLAIGDVALRPLARLGRHVALESVPNALEQARQAAATICGRPPAAEETPWNWSDQYDLKLQIAGLPDGADRTVVRGDIGRAPFAVFHLQGDRLCCVEAINAPAEFMAGRQLIGARRPVAADRLADPAVSMKQVAAAA